MSEQTPSPCNCQERRDAASTAMFFEWIERDGWAFTNGPFRVLSRGRTYWKDSGTSDDHTGEPFVYTVCPFCGGDLPLTSKPTSGEDGG